MLTRRLFNTRYTTNRCYYYVNSSNEKELSPFLQNKYNEYKKEQECEKKNVVVDFSNKLLNIQDEIRSLSFKIDNQNREMQKIASLLSYNNNIRAKNDNMDKQSCK